MGQDQSMPSQDQARRIWGAVEYSAAVDAEAVDLVQACCRNRTEEALQLIRQGAGLRAHGATGLTPLLWAVFHSNVPLVQALGEAGSKPDECCLQSKDNALAICGEQGHAAQVPVLKDLGGDFSHINAFGTLLHAPEDRTEAMVEALHAAGRDVREGPHAVHVVRCGTVENTPEVHIRKECLAIMLLQSGASAGAADEEDGMSPLYASAGLGLSNVVRELLARGASTEQATEKKRTPLFAACVGGSADIVQQLLLAGASAQHEDCRKITPLHVAAAGGNLRIMDLLLQPGADARARDARGNTPLQVAQAEGEDAVAQKLKLWMLSQQCHPYAAASP